MGMELPHIGTHCQLKSCNRLDYLPFTCKHCKMNFCEDHWKPDGHSCSKLSQVQKEVKNSTEIKSIETQKSKSKKKSKKNPCQLPNCSGYNLVHMGCGECGGNFCTGSISKRVTLSID